MIDFKMILQDDQLLYGDCGKISLISDEIKVGIYGNNKGKICMRHMY